MPKPMKRRGVEKALAAQNAYLARSGANHDVWRCSCPEGHQTAVPRHTEVTAGVVGAIIKQMPCMPKGWLQ